MIKIRLRRSATIAMALAVAAAATVAAGAFGSVKSTATKHEANASTLVVGGIFPFTGTKSLLSQWGTHGVPVGIYEVNHNGGVLGHSGSRPTSTMRPTRSTPSPRFASCC